MKLTSQMLSDAVDSIDSITTCVFRESYSGRGMGGKECAAITTESMGDLVTFGAALAWQVAETERHTVGGEDELDAIDGALHQFGRCRLDQLGRDYIVYWPEIQAS